TSFLLLRIYTKVCLLKRFWWDDVCIVLAWMFSVGTQAVILYGYAGAGYGIHIWNLSTETLSIFQRSLLAAGVIYIPALGFAKLALLMLYYRLLQTTPCWRYTIYLVTFIISGYSVALMLALIFACRPISKAWDASITTGSCIDRPAVYLATAITNTVSDVVLILIAIPIAWNLRLPFVQKLGVVRMFGLGCLTIITSIIRLTTLMPLVTSTDPTYKLGQAGLFINIEANFIILCGSLPYVRHFMRHFAPKCIGEGSRSRQKSSSQGEGSDNIRKIGLTRMQDDIEIAMNGTGEMHNANGHHNGSEDIFVDHRE
ncbi:hypothetical protein ASPWEDRAFT_112833, partial [Aspergillus wentii DTO 134E9]